MLRQPPIQRLIHIIKHKIQQVESRNERWWQIDVLRDGLRAVVFGPDGIGCCEDGCSGVECGDDAGFGNGDGLLFLDEYNA